MKANNSRLEKPSHAIRTLKTGFGNKCEVNNNNDDEDDNNNSSSNDVGEKDKGS